MTKLLYGYLSYFLHPLQVNYFFRKNRLDLNSFMAPYLVDEEEPSDLDEVMQLNFTEILSVSWIFFLIKCLYTLFFLNLGKFILNQVQISGDQMGNPKALIFFTLLQAIFFPLGFYLFAKFWEKIIAFFTTIFNPNALDVEFVSGQVVLVALSAHTFLLIPILGSVIFFIAFFIYLFAGLKYNLGFRTLPAILTILSPFFLVGFLFLLIIFLIISFILGI